VHVCLPLLTALSHIAQIFAVFDSNSSRRTNAGERHDWLIVVMCLFARTRTATR
jgi:hypothetical protein